MKNKKHIDWLTVLPTDSLGGGAEQLLMNVILHLSKNNNNNTVIILTKKKGKGWEPLETKCNVIYFSFNSVFLGYLYAIPYFLSIFLTHKINYTITSQTLINSLIGIYKRIGFLKKTKVIVRESNSIFKLLKGFKLKIYTIAYKLGYSKVDLLICQTDYMKNQLINEIKALEKKVAITVIPNPINLGPIEEKSKQKIDNLPSDPYLVAAGRLVDAKGFDILIDSFSNLLTDFPTLKLLILGQGENEKKLKDQIKSLHLTDKVIMVGFVNNVYPYFKNAKLCVLSSRIEGFPNVLLQMMTQNNKVVSTISAGDIENIDGVYKCKTNDVSDLTKAIKNCLEENTDKQRQVFDDYLNKRTMDEFIKSILSKLD